MKQPLIALSIMNVVLGLALAARASELQFQTVNREAIKRRLEGFAGDDHHREAVLKSFFQASGCAPDQLSEQVINKREESNLICVLPGVANSAIVVGAHFDHVSQGQGVVDNWSGASLLPSIFQALNTRQRRHTLSSLRLREKSKDCVAQNSM